ncbi:hypothetical protein [Cesiribacter sp. SM1]|uniref:hypothetical protein n=1 Tax=Cesiribacter sp. SM1 TaxID=2861196 RepID=UPI001CD64F02|nr:hypothetical protein [Cesiribacter sp. SM1]
MNVLRPLLMAALLAAVSVSCLKSDEPEPNIEPKNTYSATTINTDYIYIGVKGGWFGWARDSAKIKPMLERITAEGKNPGFKKQNTSLTAQPQTLSFDNGIATMMPGMDANRYSYQLTDNGGVLLLRGLDTLTVPTESSTRSEILTKMVVKQPAYNKIEAAPAEADYEYQIRSLPEQYATVGFGELQFPMINYYLKTSNGVETYGRVNNYLNQLIHQQLATGDTLMIQLEGHNFE